ncbi:MAG TPA: hypothetical protein VNQ76_02665 [Planctomicrobium sp.]|nr:hypothetical protein [Planctomicrobium sp.]
MIAKSGSPLSGIGPPKFSSGQVVITRNTLETLTQEEVHTALARHLQGDWGDCDPEDAAENELSLTEGFRLFSVYHTAAQVKFWVITEADRSVTTVLLPEDY